MHKILRVVRRGVSAAALVGLTTFAGMAQAVVFVVDWDPIFNPSFSATVGWEGTAQVTVSPGCLTPSTTSVVGVGPCTSATLDSATLRFYNPWPTSFIGSISSWTSSPTVAEVSVDAFGIVDGINLSGPLTATTGGLFAFSYDVELNFFTPDLTPPPSPPWLSTYEGPTLQLSRFIPCDFEICPTETFRSATGVKGEDLSNVPTAVWRVPEPGSLALFAVALTALGLSRRRKNW